jgi:hypothetical protein
MMMASRAKAVAKSAASGAIRVMEASLRTAMYARQNLFWRNAGPVERFRGYRRSFTTGHGPSHNP